VSISYRQISHIEAPKQTPPTSKFVITWTVLLPTTWRSRTFLVITIMQPQTQNH